MKRSRPIRLAARLLRPLRPRRSDDTRPSKTVAVFTHVPKCGGTSVDASLRAGAGIRNRDGWINPGISREEARVAVGGNVPELAIPRMLAHRAYLLFHYLRERRRFVSGHGPISPALLDSFADETPFVTVLRDPVDRWISYYISCRLASEDPNIVPNRFSTLEPEEELEKVLTSASGRYIASMFATYLGGHRPYTSDDPRDAIEPAVNALERYAVVGFVSDWADFADECSRRLGLGVEIPHLNPTARHEGPLHAQLKTLFSPGVRRRIAELCEADLAIYHEARRRRCLPPGEIPS